MLNKSVTTVVRLFLALWLAITPTFVWAGSMTLLGVGGPSGGFTPGCTQSSTFLARTSGLSNTERNAYDAMICGMVTDGVFAKLDALYIFATNTTTTANLNLISTSFPLTATGSPTFTADHGYTGNGTSSFLDTSLVLTAASHYSLNNASLGIYDLSNSNASSTLEMGVSDGASLSRFGSWNSGFAGPLVSLNANANANGTTASRQNGLWFSTMVAAGNWTTYRNGNTGSPVISSTVTPTAVPVTFSMYILGQNASGTANSFTSDQLSAAWIGGAFSAADAANFSTRLNAYMTALGINVY